jgi:hypothetical protein
MNVLGNSADGNASATDVPNDSADVGQAFGRDFTIKVRESILGAENQVREERRESMAHRIVPFKVSDLEMSPLRGLRLANDFPRLTPWAT